MKFVGQFFINPQHEYAALHEVLVEIAAQIAEANELQKIRNAELIESVNLQREELQHRYEHNANMLKVFAQPEPNESAAH